MEQCVSTNWCNILAQNSNAIFQAGQEFHRGMRVQVLLLRHPARHKELPLLPIRDADTEGNNDGYTVDPADSDFLGRITNYRVARKLTRLSEKIKNH